METLQKTELSFAPLNLTKLRLTSLLGSTRVRHYKTSDDSYLILESFTKSETETLHELWLRVSGDPIPVCFAKLHEDSRTGIIEVCSIETREDARRRGLANQLLEIAETVLETTVYSSGYYSPAGAAAFSNRPRLNSESEIVCGPSSFVLDWGYRLPRFPMRREDYGLERLAGYKL